MNGIKEMWIVLCDPRSWTVMNTKISRTFAERNRGNSKWFTQLYEMHDYYMYVYNLNLPLLQHGSTTRELRNLHYTTAYLELLTKECEHTALIAAELITVK